VSDSTPAEPELIAPSREPSTYEERKLAGVCTRGACGKLAEDGYQLCAGHRRRKNRVDRMSAKRVRAARLDAGKCLQCGEPSKTARCPGCVIKADRVKPSTGIGHSVGHDEWRRDSSGWERYRGKGHRGAPSAAINDDQDLRSALDALERGRQSLAYAHSDEVRQLGRISRRSARDAAAAILAMAARFIFEVVERNQKDPSTGIGHSVGHSPVIE
jgi:hypothetical protein